MHINIQTAWDLSFHTIAANVSRDSR